MSDLLTADQAASELGYHLNYFYTLRQEKVRAQQFNRVWMVDHRDVERIKTLQGQGGRLTNEPKQS